MPAIPITSPKQYENILEVLDRVGGPFQGVGFEERFLLVSPRQYEALVEAKVITPEATTKDPKRGKNPVKRTKP